MSSVSSSLALDVLSVFIPIRLMFSTYILPLFTKIYNRKTNFFHLSRFFHAKLEKKKLKAPDKIVKASAEGESMNKCSWVE
jgi:hypothetical protein